MTISIVTINYNNLSGLSKTLKSVSSQSVKDFEHVIIDGGSGDGSVEMIKEYAECAGYPVKWVSERDKGIYNAMNKGILMATGEYVQILNSGDILAGDDVIGKIRKELSKMNGLPILYGNMLKDFGGGKLLRDNCGGAECTLESFLYFYDGTLNHDCAFIRRDLFDKYGLYNEQMKICSDWEWYVRAIALGGEKTHYFDIDVTVFDMSGISESGGRNRNIIKMERRQYLESILPPSVLRDYDSYSGPVCRYNRLKRHHLWPVVSFVERVLFKFEKWGILK